MLRRINISPWLLAALATSVALLVTLFVISRVIDDDDDEAAVQPTATAPADQEPAVRAAAESFISAIRNRDADALYAVQSDEYKQGCTREDFQPVADSAFTTSFEGPSQVVVTDRIAGVTVILIQPDGTRQEAVMPWEQASDGSWRVSSPTTGGCLPQAPAP